MDEVVVDGHAVGELDLVEELRFFADATDADGVVVTMLSGRTFGDAADEIERLRSEVDVLRVCYDELVLRVDHVDVDGTPSDPFVPVLLAPWVVDVLTDPHASMHQERVESIWLSVVESCERAKGVMF